MPEKIVVIGSNSFSGASFVAYALAGGASVLATSRSAEPHPTFLPYRWSDSAPDPARFRFEALDLNHDTDRIADAVAAFRPDYVINFAAQSMVAESWLHPDHWYQTNVVANVRLHEKLRRFDFIRRYVQHLSLVLKKEKYKNALTGKMEDPDFPLIEEFEKIIEAPTTDAELGNFRNGIVSQIGAWSLDHPNAPVVYSKVFPEYWRKLEKHYYQSQKELLTKMHDALLLYGRAGDRSDDALSTNSGLSEGQRLAKITIENMQKNLGYTEEGAKEVITFLMKSRYH